jgi:hypothetical protein
MNQTPARVYLLSSRPAAGTIHPELAGEIRMTTRRFVLSIAALTSAFALPLHAQVAITPMIGGYLPAGSLNDVTNGAQNVAKTRNGTLALGVNLDLGPIRGTAMYASGTTIKNANEQDIAKGNVLAAAADLVVRPIPRILVQPYLLVGAGEKFTTYDNGATLVSGENKHTFAFHGGVGADLMLGSIGVAAELTDFLSRNSGGKWNVHDAFLMAGLRLALGH